MDWHLISLLLCPPRRPQPASTGGSSSWEAKRPIEIYSNVSRRNPTWFDGIYSLVKTNIATENPLWMEVFTGKSLMNGPCSIATLIFTRGYMDWIWLGSRDVSSYKWIMVIPSHWNPYIHQPWLSDVLIVPLWCGFSQWLSCLSTLMTSKCHHLLYQLQFQVCSSTTNICSLVEAPPNFERWLVQYMQHLIIFTSALR